MNEKLGHNFSQKWPESGRGAKRGRRERGGNGKNEGEQDEETMTEGQRGRGAGKKGIGKDGKRG